MKSRLTWEEYALKLAFTAAERSEDPYIKVGCCLLRHDKSIGSLGFNGAPPNVEIDWADRDKRRIRVSHAENNAFRYVKPGECYLIATTMNPCSNCMVQIRSYGIKKIIYQDIYKRDENWEILAKEFGIEVERIEHLNLKVL